MCMCTQLLILLLHMLPENVAILINLSLLLLLVSTTAEREKRQQIKEETPLQSKHLCSNLGGDFMSRNTRIDAQMIETHSPSHSHQ